jgi:hypothetical protein
VYVVIKGVEQQEDKFLWGKINMHLDCVLHVKSGDLIVAGQQIGMLLPFTLTTIYYKGDKMVIKGIQISLSRPYN